MSTAIHLPTVLFLHQSSLLVGALVFMHLRRQSSRTKGLGILVLAYGALGVGALIAGFGERIVRIGLPDEIGAHLSVFLGLLGYTLVWAGFRILGGRNSWRHIRQVLWVPVLFSVVGLVSGFPYDFKVRAVVIHVFGIVSMLATAWSIGSGYRSEPLPSRRLLVFTMCVSASAYIGDLVILASGSEIAIANVFFLQILCNFGVALLAVTLVNERTEMHLRRVAHTDPLTGVGNRRWFMSHLPPKIALGMAVVIMDLDHFKQVNDRFGHAMGDQVLVKFAQYISSMLREHDAFARYGGEEFVLFLPDVTAAKAFAVADRLREGVAALVCEDDLMTPVSITVSMGVAVTTGRDTAWQALLNRADQALYAAKAAGRNRVMADGDGVVVPISHTLPHL